MELSPTVAELYVRHAFSQMLDVAERLGEPAINQRPLGDETNSVAALVIHCCGVSEFWLGHVALDRASSRDRESEFSAMSSLSELRTRVDAAVTAATADIERLDAGQGSDAGGRQFMPGGDDPANRSDAAVLLHVVEELFQHLGHMEMTADVLSARR